MRNNEKKDLAYEIIDYFKKNKVEDKRLESIALDFLLWKISEFIEYLDIDIEEEDDDDDDDI